MDQGADPGTAPERTVPDPRVVLLRDSRWDGRPGVCCWRHSIHAAFGELGAELKDVSWRGSGAAGAADRELGDSLAGAALVVAEALEAAETAVTSGVPRQRVYALALPPEPLHLGAPSTYGEQLAQVARVIGGFLTDSELARESLEQAVAANRPQVEIFPPLAIDRTCPSCQDAAPTGRPTNPRSELAQLGLWRALIEEVRAGGRPGMPDSFLAARLLGLAGPWATAQRPGWHVGPVDSPRPEPDPGEPGRTWSVAAQLRGARRVWETVSSPASAAPRPPRAALVAGFNLKFAKELTERLDARPDLDITVDEWPSESKPTEFTEKLLAGAESIFAEWVRPSAVWLSQRKRPDQFLAVRLHRYEIYSRHPQNVVIDNVDAVVYIAPMFGRRIRDELGWPAEKLVYIPNFLDIGWFDRPKLPEARFGLGMVGMESMRKRFDLALDLLAEVRRADPRFTLFVRSVLPWDNPLIWKRPAEREYAGWCMERIRRDPQLRGGVVFEPPGRDMARWFRRVGHILSTSDDEGSHMAPAEGMASGAVPVIRPWPGAVEIYDIEWIHTATEDAAAAVLANADVDHWSERAARAQAEIRRSHDPAAVLSAWTDLLHGDVASAKAHFEAYVAG